MINILYNVGDMNILANNVNTLLILMIGVIISYGTYGLYRMNLLRKYRDILPMLCITLIYSFVSFYRLGSHQIPTTTWQPTTMNQEIIFSFDDIESFDRIYTIYGEGDNNANPTSYQIGTQDIHLYGSNDMHTWQPITTLPQGSYYMYSIIEGSWNYHYIKLVSDNTNNSLSEIGFRNFDHSSFLHVSILKDANNTKYPAQLLIDEQDKLVMNPTYYDQVYFDEVYHVRNAWEIANGQYMYATVHPLLGTNIIALSIKIFGMNPFAWRLPGVLAGILMIPVAYAILKMLCKKNLFANIGCVLLAADFMHITTSRIGTLEPFSILFILCAYAWMLKYCLSDYYSSKSWKYLFLSGTSMAVSIAVKWTGCYSAVGLALMLFSQWFVQWRKDTHNKKFYQMLFTNVLMCIAFFILIPVVIYLISYIPDHIYRNESWSIAGVIRQAISMYQYHTNLQATHPFQSTWVQWIFDLRPIWYYFTQIGHSVYTIACFSNPLLTWIGILAIVYTCMQAIIKKDKIAWYILMGFLSNLLPWVIYIERVVFAYHFYPSSLFMIFAIVYTISKLHTYPKLHRRIYTYLTLYVLLFVLFLPVTTGIATTIDYVHFLEWLPGWYFG